MGGPIAKAMVVIRRPRDGAILVAADVDRAGTWFERPLGGHIEFGERAADTARRELREEIDQELRGLRLLDVIENMFTLDGIAGHEIVFLFEADFVDSDAYEIDAQVVRDEPAVRVRWRGPDQETPRLVPEGIDRHIRRRCAGEPGRGPVDQASTNTRSSMSMSGSPGSSVSP